MSFFCKREKAMRLGHPHGSLKEGSKVCVEAWGTVYGRTAGGEALIVLDSDSHLGVILAPKDSERELPHEVVAWVAFEESPGLSLFRGQRL